MDRVDLSQLLLHRPKIMAGEDKFHFTECTVILKDILSEDIILKCSIDFIVNFYTVSGCQRELQ